jgi:DNA-binding NarL/FixJ family response regulator
MPATVLVVNDDNHLSSLLEQLLAGDPRLVVVGKARTPIAAQALAWEAMPDAVVVEQHGSGIPWWDELVSLRRYCPDGCLVLLTDLSGDELPTQAKVADHVLPRTSSWAKLADLLAPPTCDEEAAEPLPLAQ